MKGLYRFSMNILITGARGFVGRHLEKYLADKYNIFLTAREKNNPKYIFLDLLCRESVNKFINIMSDKDIDVLIHTAGELVNGKMTDDEQMVVFDHNIEMSKSVIKIVQELNIKKLINCSSMAVYPNEDGIYDETSEIRMSCNSECMYGLSKFCSENMFTYFLKSECNVINLRLAQIYGEGMRNDRIVSIMKGLIIENNSVEIYGEGKRISNFISIDKVCRIIFKLVDSLVLEGIYNVGDKNLTYLEVAQKLVEKWGNPDTQIILKQEGIRSQFILNVNKINCLWRD